MSVDFDISFKFKCLAVKIGFEQNSLHICGLQTVQDTRQNPCHGRILKAIAKISAGFSGSDVVKQLQRIELHFPEIGPGLLGV